MEKSLSSCMNTKPVVPSKDNCPDEESGWTAYFEDFSNYNREQSFDTSNNSLLSDAASCAAWKISHNNLKIPKKTRTKIISIDDSLEDTASSPVSSPKVRSSILSTFYFPFTSFL